MACRHTGGRNTPAVSPRAECFPKTGRRTLTSGMFNTNPGAYVSKEQDTIRRFYGSI
jgi:hypothetical protein